MRLIAFALCVCLIVGGMPVVSAEETLRIQHYMGIETFDIKKYDEEHGTINVKAVLSDDLVTPDKVMRRMTEDIADLFIVHSAQPGFRALIEAEIAATIYQEYVPEQFRSYVSVNDLQYAWVIAVRIDQMMTYAVSQKVMSSCGLIPSDFATDFSSLLTQLTNWYQDGTLSGVRILPNENQRDLLVYIVADFLRYTCCQGTIEDVDIDLLTELLRKGEILVSEMERQNCTNSSYPYLLTPCTQEDYIFDSLSTGVLQTTVETSTKRFDETQVLLQCVPDAGMELYLPVVLDVAVFNPNAEHVSMAEKFLKEVQEYHVDLMDVIVTVDANTITNDKAHVTEQMKVRAENVLPRCVVISETYEAWMNQIENVVSTQSLAEGTISVEEFVGKMISGI